MNSAETTFALEVEDGRAVHGTVGPLVLRRGIGGHQSAAIVTDEWLTPPEIINTLGRFDLDPAAPVQRPWPTADRHFTIEDDGLRKQWEGRVWLNPPYDSNIGAWMGKLAAHGDGIGLVFARTETQWFVSEVWRKADGILFIHGRIYFHYVTGARASSNSGAPSCLVAYGADNVTALRQSGIAGTVVTWEPQNVRSEGLT